LLSFNTVCKIVETTLRREGYAVLTFPDGVAALTWLAERTDAAPRLLLLDIALPRMDGYALARALKAKPACANAAIVLMSRRDGVVDRLKGRLIGARAYLAKPFTTQMLLTIVQQACAGEADGSRE
jgi:twitching motility two-component system response regulator PilG